MLSANDDEIYILYIFSATENALSSSSKPKNIDTIAAWTKTWMMRLSTIKCKVLDLGKNIERKNYAIYDLNRNEKRPIEKYECEKDLGVIIYSDLK